MSKRIWELDALRGLALIGMMGIHLVYDLVELYRVWSWNPVWYQVFKNNYGAIFLVISGISVTLGRHPVKRGLQVFCCGGLCTLVTYGMYRLGFAGKDIIIYIGVLQCLGLCMMLWPVFKKLPGPPLVLLAGAMVILGLWLRTVSFSFPWLTVLGFAPTALPPRIISPCFPTWGIFSWGPWQAGPSTKKSAVFTPWTRPRCRCFGGWGGTVFFAICCTSPFWRRRYGP